MATSKSSKTKGMFLLIDRENDQGLKHWCDELEKRSIPAVIQMTESTLDSNCNLVRNLSGRGFEIGGAYNEGPFLNEPYEFQYEKMSLIKDKIQSCINKPMRIVHSEFFTYDETTLKVADELGIKYVLARGTAGARAVVYKPKEYDAKILSVTRVQTSDRGTTSLCDCALRGRGEVPDSFREILFGFREDWIILVAQTHISGVKLHWWNVYQDFLNANIVNWESLDEFTKEPIILPNAEIPINTSTEYVVPNPKIPLEEEEDYPVEA